MLEINLVPVDLRKRKKKASPFVGFHFPVEILIGLGSVIVFVLMLINFSLFYQRLAKAAQYAKLQKQLEEIRPEQEKVKAMAREIKDIEEQVKSIRDIIGDQRVNWSQKLNILSDTIPRGVWFTKVSAQNGMFVIEGSSITKEQDAVMSLQQVISDLKKNQKFLDYLADVRMGGITRRYVNTVEVADFSITGRIK